jgi:hypothetical protein
MLPVEMIERKHTLNVKASATNLRFKTPKRQPRRSISRDLIRSFSNTDLRLDDTISEVSDVPRISTPQPLSPNTTRKRDPLQCNAKSEGVGSLTNVQEVHTRISVDQIWKARVSGIVGALCRSITLTLTRAILYHNIIARYQRQSSYP